VFRDVIGISVLNASRLPAKKVALRILAETVDSV
jgi:hypothetical protein